MDVNEVSVLGGAENEGGMRMLRGGEGMAIGTRRKGWAKKRPSVETEGRLTIACHMKNLKRSML